MDDPGLTAFTAIIQVGAIVAVIIYFRTDVARPAVARGRGQGIPAARRRGLAYWFAWYIIAGSIPIGIVGVVRKDVSCTWSHTTPSRRTVSC